MRQRQIGREGERNHTEKRSTHIFTPTSLLEQLKAMNKPEEEVTS